MNTSNRHLIAAAVCIVLGGTAHALDRVEYISATKIYFAGSTVTDGLLEDVFLSNVGGICDALLGDIDIWRTVGQRVITCRASNENTPGRGFAPRAANGTMVAFHKESQGINSSNGVFPLIAVATGNAHALRWLDVSQLVNNCTTSIVAPTPLLAGYANHSACATALTPVDTAGSATYDVHGGISDIEPALAYPPPGPDADLLAADVALSVVMGVPVTRALYRALQKGQFGHGSACDGSDAQACVPALESTQLVELYTQATFDWNNVTTPGTGVSIMDAPGVVPPADDFVRICRRVAASSAQASFEAALLRERCDVGVAGFAFPDDASTIDDVVYSPNDFASGSFVNAAVSSADVRSCLTGANTSNFWAVGVLSTEVSGTDPGYRFIGINGVAPNRTNVANRGYSFFTESTVNRIRDGVGSLPDGDLRSEMVELVRDTLGPVWVRVHVDRPAAPFGIGGVLAPCGTPSPATAPYSDAEMAAYPVNTQTRGGNTCGPVVMCPAP